MSIPTDIIPGFMKIKIENLERQHREIPQFSKEYRYSWEYIEGQINKGKFNPNSSYGKRMIRNALEHPHWTLEDWRGHGKPTEKVFQYFDDQGKFSEGIQFKNRQEEGKYASYLNAVKNYLDSGEESDLKKFKGKTVIDKDGQKQKLVTNKETLNNLARFSELPSGEDIYIN